MSPQVSDFIPAHPLSIPLAFHSVYPLHLSSAHCVCVFGALHLRKKHYICVFGALHLCLEHYICVGNITFVFGALYLCLWSITFVFGVLHGSSVYPTLHQEWTLSKHTLFAAIFHVYIYPDISPYIHNMVH